MKWGAVEINFSIFEDHCKDSEDKRKDVDYFQALLK